MTRITREEFFEKLPTSKGIWMALATINELVNEGYSHEDTNKILEQAVQEHANCISITEVN
ncbi:hypothetical protein ACIQ1D_18560 [Lysinibacillus xylanilyticus]|uniref:Uncharacterized protein n=1 Tax=Lysinibacillus xylanilyticus TaxID=582475 RepID=A0A2M9Q5N6_9BACI|nr:hypothetical protein [Lysinibacillus xylanilyticus]PJO43391.1 hypothetical protein CWD94_12630 [Lysinibacillus xylanilyticus]